MGNKERAEVKAEAAGTFMDQQALKIEPKFVVAKLRSNCVTVFGVTSSTFDGAMYGHDLEAEYTIGEVKKIINDFLNGGK